MNNLKIAKTVAMTGAGAVVGTMIAADKNDQGFYYNGNPAPTFIGMGVGAAVGGIGIPVAAKLAKGSALRLIGK